MNAPAHIVPPHLAEYVPAVLTFMPGCHGKELEYRCRLMSARDSASVAISRSLCSEEAAGVVSEMARLATLYAYAPMELEDLRNLLEALRAMMKASHFLDEFAGGAGARG